MGSSPIPQTASSETEVKAETRNVTRKRVRLLYEHRINLYALLVALPGIVVSGIFIWFQPLVRRVRSWRSHSRSSSRGGCWLSVCTRRRFAHCRHWLM